MHLSTTVMLRGLSIAIGQSIIRGLRSECNGKPWLNNSEHRFLMVRLK